MVDVAITGQCSGKRRRRYSQSCHCGRKKLELTNQANLQEITKRTQHFETQIFGRCTCRQLVKFAVYTSINCIIRDKRNENFKLWKKKKEQANQGNLQEGQEQHHILKQKFLGSNGHKQLVKFRGITSAKFIMRVKRNNKTQDH